MASPDTRPFTWHYTEIDDRDLEIRGRTLFFVIVLFSIILLVTVLFIYTRWVCRYQGLLPTTAFSAATHAPSLPQSQGLDPATLKKLPIILHHAPSDRDESSWDETECCICLGEFRDGEKVKGLTSESPFRFLFTMRAKLT
ncbi:RING-H2 finger protein [Vigna angularis]|uniref:RING-H2 finger protein n=1 Tax=Phaseolus angularis TaxID=3914 RepID=A0A8T0L447_PHAAN|nr:RING-H2 finger protein [Vigna angularis]